MTSSTGDLQKRTRSSNPTPIDRAAKAPGPETISGTVHVAGFLPALSRAEIAEKMGDSRANLWRLANSANRDHLSTTVERVERLHELIVGVGVSQATQR
jgi:hypothetical protein